MVRLLSLLFIISISFADTKNVAISYFDNTSGTEEYNPLSKGLADMLITDLSNIKSLKIVEREKLETLLKEIELGDSKFIDPNTAQKLGKGLGAGYMLTGSFLIMGETMRIDARLVDVGTGEISMAEEITGEKDTFFELEKNLVNKIIATLNIDLSKTESRKVKKVQTESFESFNNYSSSIDAFDKGEYEKSKEFMEKAANLDEDFDLAWDKLEDIEKYIEELMLIRQSGLDARITELILNLGNLTDSSVNAFMIWFLSINNPIDNIYPKPEWIKEDWEKWYTSFGDRIGFINFIIEKYHSNKEVWNYDYYGSKISTIVTAIEASSLLSLKAFEKDNEFYKNYYRPDLITDKNGTIMIKYDSINDIIIKKLPIAMKNDMHSPWFETFKQWLDEAIKEKKSINE